jgi:hypothetical protein
MCIEIKGLSRLFLLLALAVPVTRALDNPLPSLLDGAVVQYNGSYYAMSGETNGQMLSSGTLTEWTSPKNIIPETVPGPYELIYRNGFFYLYAEGAGVAVADKPDGPFSQVRRAGLSGEEMRLYQDGSGALFSVNRRLGSKREGEIWLQPYAAPWKTAGRSQQLLDGRYGQWDSLDSADLGDPEIFNYRGNYYLLYAANNPSPRTGLREVGVAMNENPTRLSNLDKVTDPVLIRNVDRLARDYTTLLPTGEYYAWRARYTTRKPEGEWTRPGYKYSKWRTGDGGFGSPNEINGAQLHACRTKWTENEIWVRREFDLPRGRPEKTVLNIRHEGAVEVYLNGTKIFETTEPSISYSNFDVSEAANAAFTPKDNVLAVHAVVPSKAKYRFIDFGLFDAGTRPVEDTIYGLSGPRVIRGPNGFEQWMIYQAWWNGKPGTGLDRVYYFDEELVVDGPTTSDSPGYHPPPAQPTFSDTFPEHENTEWAERWTFSGGAWVSADGMLRQNEAGGPAKAYLNAEPAEHYLFETYLRFPLKGKGAVGVVAWSDGEQDLVISVNPSTKSWSYHIDPSPLAPKKSKLPKAFKLLEVPPGIKHSDAPLHRLRITKNGGNFDVELNGIRLVPEKPIVTKIEGPGVPGLYCGDSVAEFDGVTYTIGWDEHNEYINGWGSAQNGSPPGGEWRHDRELGLQQRSHSQTGRAFKGDLLDQYEFRVNVQLRELEEGSDRLYGVFPVFIDKDNYLKAMINTKERELVVTGKRNGREITPVHKSLKTSIVHRHLYDKSTAYRDVTSWVYGLRSESIVTGLDIRWLEGEFNHLRQEFYVPHDDMRVRYAQLERGRRPNLWEDGRFYDADEPKPLQQEGGVLNRVTIRPQKANYIGFGLFTSGTIVIDSRTGRYIRDYVPGEELGDNEEISDDTAESDTMARPQETLVHIEVESSYFFRCVKLEDRVIIELNGRPMVTIEESWPASQVGLVTEGQPCFFDGITLMHLPDE